MLRGRHEHIVDPKGRIAVPAQFRQVLRKEFGGDRVVVTKHLTDPCLVVYPVKSWQAFEQRIAQLPTFDRKAKLIRRIYVGGAQDCDLDKQGRILLRADLRSEAGIEGEVIWNGQISFAEIWSKAAFEANVLPVKQQLEAGDMPELEEALAELGI